MRTRTGTVVSAKNDKTAVVLVHTKRMHPILKKSYRSSKKYHVHDDTNECQEGDEVMISETRPLSKLKRWKIEKVLTRGGVAETLKEEILGEVEKPKKKKEVEIKEEIEKKEFDEKVEKEDKSEEENKEIENNKDDTK